MLHFCLPPFLLSHTHTPNVFQKCAAGRGGEHASVLCTVDAVHSCRVVAAAPLVLHQQAKERKATMGCGAKNKQVLESRCHQEFDWTVWNGFHGGAASPEAGFARLPRSQPDGTETCNRQRSTRSCLPLFFQLASASSQTCTGLHEEPSVGALCSSASSHRGDGPDFGRQHLFKAPLQVLHVGRLGSRDKG